jgi:hypothetical protein
MRPLPKEPREVRGNHVEAHRSKVDQSRDSLFLKQEMLRTSVSDTGLDPTDLFCVRLDEMEDPVNVRSSEAQPFESEWRMWIARFVTNRRLESFKAPLLKTGEFAMSRVERLASASVAV